MELCNMSKCRWCDQASPAQSTAWCVYQGRKGRARGCVCGVCALCLICALNGGAQQPYLLIKVADMLLQGGVGGNGGGKLSEQTVLDPTAPGTGSGPMQRGGTVHVAAGI